MYRICLGILFLTAYFPVYSYAAPCYGTKLPAQGKFFLGVQSHTVFKRYLEDNLGKLRSTQGFLLLSYGAFDWFSLDLKGGAGNIKHRPVGSDEIDYPTFLGGGYGFRLKAYDERDVKIVFGFQHISIHPYRIFLGDVKEKAVLDEWQFSLLASYAFKKITPYIGTKWSRSDYIRWVQGNRKREKSDLAKSAGLVLGFDLPVSRRTWINLEGQFFDSEAIAFSLNYSF